MLTSRRIGLDGIKTKSFTETDISGGLFGFFDPTTTAGRRKFQRTNDGFGGVSSDLTVIVTGHTCFMRMGGGANQPFVISVDGAAWSMPAIMAGSNTDGLIPIFVGLADGPHLVRMHGGASHGNNAWNYTSGEVFRVTGRNPAATAIGPSWMITDASFPGAHTFALASRPTGVNIVPTNSDTSYAASNYCVGGSIKINAKCSEIWVFTGDEEAFYAVDTGSMVQTALTDLSSINGDRRAWKRVAAGLDRSAYHDYTITTGSTGTQNRCTLGVMVAGPNAAFGTISATKKWIQYGDSISYIAGVIAGQTNACGDIYKTAAALGFIGASCGVSGQTAAQLNSTLATARAQRNITEDRAIVAIGRNNWGAADVTTDVTAICNTLLGAGVGKVLVRGTNFGNGGGANAVTTDSQLAAAVTAVANANCVFIPVTGWTGINLADGTHPSAAGYATMAGYAVTDYAPYV